LGGHSGGDTPLPIPNREVKPASADGTRGASPRESRTPPTFYEGRREAAFVVRTLPRVELRDGDLLLRPWIEDDVPALVAACNDVEISYWIPLIPSPYTNADALAFIREEVTPDENSFAIVSDDILAGAIGMAVNSMNHRGRIGYWVAREARGQGICTRALRLLSRWGLDEVELQRLELITDPDNVASQRVAEKVGFHREGVLRAHLRHPDGRIRDSVMFSLLPGELT
jgi:RimJ/RimL family protein N-acetyltransferase